MKTFAAYTRVSTNGQGLGLEAQTAIINQYAQNNAGKIVARFEEKQSGKTISERQELQAAITYCKQHDAVLVVAKLDRLSRDICDIFTLKKDKNLRFEVCDLDAADTLTLGIFAALAQKERELISKRTKEALAALKAKGAKLGRPDAAEHIKQYTAKAVEAKRNNALNNDANKKAFAVISQMQCNRSKKAEYLNANGFTTRRGKQWTSEQVKRLEALFTVREASQEAAPAKQINRTAAAIFGARAVIK